MASKVVLYTRLLQGETITILFSNVETIDLLPFFNTQKTRIEEHILQLHSVDGAEVTTVDLVCGAKIPDDVFQALTDDKVTKYSEVLVRCLIEKITVYDEKLVVEFKSALQIEVEA